MTKPYSKYQIELDITNSDATRRAVDDIEKSMAKISDYAKADNLSEGLKSARDQAEMLSRQLKDIDANSEGATAQFEAFGKAANKAISDLERQATKLTYSLSEKGRAQRDILESLKAELRTLGNSRQEQQRARDLTRQINAIQRQVVAGSDEELQNALSMNRATRATLRISQQESRLLQAQANSQTTLAKLVKADLIALKEKLRMQFQFIQALKTTEGRYNAIKKAAASVGKTSAALGKAGFKGGGMAAGGLLALGGVAMSQAENMVQREREANRIKASLSKDDKQVILSDLYMQTGADYSTIVDAINRVISVIGKGASQSEIIQAANAEIRYPGSAAIFMQQNTHAPTAAEFVDYGARLRAVQQTTGASIDQITNSASKIANMRQSSFSNASMLELQSLYLALQNSGAFDSDDELDRAFKSFVRVQKDSDKSVFELAKEWQAGGRWSRTAYGATNQTQATNALNNIDFGAIGNSVRQTTETNQTEAEKTAQKMREIEEAKNKMLMKLVEAIAPVIETLPVEDIAKFFSDIIQKAMPKVKEIVNGIQDVVEAVQKLYAGIKDSWFFDADSAAAVPVPTLEDANGGVVSMPSLVGEAGSEMIVPLDYSRLSRGRQLTQNLTQYFNMSGNETTALSLSQAVQSRDFTRAMMNTQYLNNRLGR